MRRISAYIVLVTIFTAGPAATAGDWHDHHRFIVTTSWVHERLKDPRLVLFQVGDRKEYDSLHLPGAQHLPVRDFAKPYVEGSLVLELPDPSALDSTLEARGITDSSIIVIYPGKDWFSPSARIYLTLEWFGLGGRAYLMDGGMQAWAGEGKPLTAETLKVARGSVTPRVRDDVVVTKEWVPARLEDAKVSILDSRNPNFYTGQDTGNASRPGHIPGARNLPFDTLVDSTGRFLKPEAAATLFAEAGMAEGKTAVSYCHVGQQASLVWLMARFAGYDARMYDGSMQEWTRDPDAPLVKEGAK
jgi:thiosulfate/3-mercaptopyruvate sulfurtransferase